MAENEFLARLTPAIGFDLGSSRIRVWSPNLETIIDEAACLAVDQHTGRVVAVGDEAAAMQGRVAQGIQVFFPIKQGEVKQYRYAQALLRFLMQRVLSLTSFFRPVIMASVPADLTPAKRTITTELLASLGASEVITISQPLAAAIGSGVPIADSSGCFIVQAGEGVVEAAIISLGSVVVSQQTLYAGHYLDEQIIENVRKTHNLAISFETARELKKRVGSMFLSDTKDKQRVMLTSGQDIVTATPKEIEVSAADLEPALQRIASYYERLVHQVLTKVPPELTVDIIDKGMLLSGGLAQLRGLDQWLVDRVGVAVSVVDQPKATAIKGIATALEHLPEFRESLLYASS